MAGNESQALAKAELGVKALQEALNGLPLGSPIHTAVFDAAKKLSVALKDHATDKAATMQAIVAMARQNQPNENQRAAFDRAAPPPPGGGGAATPPALAA